jgi:hypothetical protein
MTRAFAGLAYGCALVAIGVLAAGAGHGTNVLMAAAAAPLGFLGAWGAIAGAPILWAAVGAALAWLPRRSRKLVVASAVIIHYVSAASLLVTPEWEYLIRNIRPLWAVMAAWMLVYGVGQGLIWRVLRVEK